MPGEIDPAIKRDPVRRQGCRQGVDPFLPQQMQQIIPRRLQGVDAKGDRRALMIGRHDRRRSRAILISDFLVKPVREIAERNITHRLVIEPGGAGESQCLIVVRHGKAMRPAKPARRHIHHVQPVNP